MTCTPGSCPGLYPGRAQLGSAGISRQASSGLTGMSGCPSGRRFLTALGCPGGSLLQRLVGGSRGRGMTAGGFGH